MSKLEDFVQAMRKDDSSEIGKTLEDLVNNLCFHPATVWDQINAEAPDILEDMKKMAVEWIRYAGENQVWTDGRNEYAVDICKKVYASHSYKSFANIKGNVIICNAVEYSQQRFHRTLYSTASYLMGYILNQMSNTLAAEMGVEEWYRMPII